MLPTGSNEQICIVGAGPVGLYLARALSDAGFRCRVLESRGPDQFRADRRGLALSWGSHLKLLGAGVDLRKIGTATPILAVHVSQCHAVGRTHLLASDISLPALGFVATYGDVVDSILKRARETCEIDFGTTVERIDDEGDGVRLTTSGGPVAARVAVIADGGGALLDSAGFTVRSDDYGVHALVGTVHVAKGSSGTAFERFTDHGPLALLPSFNGYALVWTLPPEIAERLVSASSGHVLDALQQSFGWRLGRFLAIRDRGAFPLSLRRTSPIARGNVAVIGNAAQTLHPVAGQGLNLGLRDAWALTKALTNAGNASAKVLEGYAASRQLDRTVTIGITDFLARAFRVSMPGAAAARACGLEILDLLPVPRRSFTSLLTSVPLR